MNEQTRYAQYNQEKKITAEAEKLLMEQDSQKSSGDVVLNEAVNIAADLSRLP